jgi:PAS domain S-box-containing protein
MTAYADDQYVSRAKQVEPYGYILKPFQEEEVRAAIEVALHRKQVERGFFRSMGQLRAIVDTFDEAVISLDGAGKVIFWNRRAADLFGYSEVEMTGKKIAPFLSDSAGKRLEQLLAFERHGTESGDAGMRVLECRGRRKDGEELILTLHPTLHRMRNERFITCIVREKTLLNCSAFTFQGHGTIISGKIISICSYCSKIRDDEGNWHSLTDFLSGKMDFLFSHGICPACMETLFSDLTEGE